MKRSEMVKLIAERLPIDGYDGDEEEREDHADGLLSFLESQGMCFSYLDIDEWDEE